MNFIQRFQSKYGLLADGIIGQKTLLKIKEVYCIDTNEQVAHLVGQCDHETGGFRTFEENLNYSAEALIRTWPRHFNSENAQDYARKPEKIANRAYANRMGNGDEASGDGWKYRGRGAIQLTGKFNVQAFAIAEGEDFVNYPEKILNYFFEPAIFFFDRAQIWDLARRMDDGAIFAVTRKINGGTHGIADRMAKTKKYFGMM